jgi:hypothetical protein
LGIQPYSSFKRKQYLRKIVLNIKKALEEVKLEEEDLLPKISAKACSEQQPEQ